ncbi:MAG: hypothetical protein M5U23_10145 [Acidimicrobiia bacterium]|nr:hypothetical protein [Acidimicrobiia bacterium]
MTYSFSFTFFVTSGTGRRVGVANLENLADELMHAMTERETDMVFDSSVGGVLTAGEIDVEVTVEAASEGPAAAIARDFIIESIKATGGTPMGIFVFPPKRPRKMPRQEWHERRAELTNA